MNRRSILGNLGPCLFMTVAAIVLVGCQGVALTNRTNQPVYAGGVVEPYNADQDIFLYGPPTWQYRLRVRQGNGVSRSSIQPSLVIDNEAYPMSLSGDWDGSVSYWVHDWPVECTTGGTPYASDSEYYFVVAYDRSSLLVSEPPAGLPSSGTYTSRILNLELYYEPTRPYPNHARGQGMIYDQNCWETGTGCVAVWKRSELLGAYWPDQLAYTFVLRNSGPVDYTITALSLGPLGLDTTSYLEFEIGNTNLPLTVPACVGTAEITLIYNLHPPLGGDYSLQLLSEVQWSGSSVTTGGPRVNVDYDIAYNVP